MSLPQAIEAEQAVLGAILLRPESLPVISDWLHAADFCRDDHRAIYASMLQTETIDPFVLADKLGKTLGDYLMELWSSTPSAANIAAYAEIVREKSLLRQLIQVGTEAANAGADAQGSDAQQLIADTMRKLTRLSLTDRHGGLEPPKPMLRSWFESLRALWERGDAMTGLPTPWKLVNDLTYGLQPADLIVVGGRPAMGKSVLGFGLSMFTALRGDRTALFSLEMSSAQVLQRMASALHDIPHDWLRSPASSDADHWPLVTAAIRDLSQSALLIDDEAGLSIAQITARAKREHARSPLKLVVIDHMHIIKRAGKNPTEELGEISRGCKALAKSLNCPVVALAQLNRGNADRQDKRPTLTDLRQSGDIEQDADVIFLMHREGYYDKAHIANDVELIVGKGRNMPQGQTITLANRYDVMRLDDWRGDLPHAPAKPVRGFGNRFADARAGA